jgi:hypothetical protein
VYLVLVADLNVHVLESLNTSLEEFELRGKCEHLLGPSRDGMLSGKYSQW